MTLARIAAAGLVAGVSVALTASPAVAVDQTAKNGCNSPESYSGTLTSPAFTTASGESIVRFQAWFEGESVNPLSHDLALAQYSLNGGPWQTGLDLKSEAPGGGAGDVPYSDDGTGQ